MGVDHVAKFALCLWTKLLVISVGSHHYLAILRTIFVRYYRSYHHHGYAYVADISTPEEKAQNFGLLGAAFGLGFIIGPVIGGILGEYGARLPHSCRCFKFDKFYLWILHSSRILG